MRECVAAGPATGAGFSAETPWWGAASVSDSGRATAEGAKELEQQQQRRRLQRGRITTVLSLYGTALLNGMARRTLSSAMPVLVARRAWTQEQAKEISFLGYQGYALGRVLAIPALITFGHKGTMLLNLAVICMATMGFVWRACMAAFTRSGCKSAAGSASGS